MTLELRYAVRSDVGLLREGNEDSAYAGPRLLAVADGMGGHAAGEVASALTIASMAELDAEQVSGDMLKVLAMAVAMANARLQEKIIANPAVEGMGTTLTALLWSDGHAAVCHIGDSRGYLLREGELYQITHDHTLVQSLVDEGRISADDVSTHPQRSCCCAPWTAGRSPSPTCRCTRACPATGTCCARTACPAWSATRRCGIRCRASRIPRPPPAS